MKLPKGCHWLGFILGGALLSTSCAGIEPPVDRTGPVIVGTAAFAVNPSEQGTDGSPAAVAPVLPSGPITITANEAILMCLENNRSLVVERLTPAIRQTAEEQERALFDPVLSAAVAAGRVEGERLARSGSETEAFTTDTADGTISLATYFPTGTSVALEAGTTFTDSSLYDDRFYEARLGMTVNQALLRGLGAEVNLVQLRQARLDTRMSGYELRGFTESLVAEVEQTYWDYALAQRQIEIVEESLKVARQQRDETETLIAVGRLARSELAAVQAEVAAQEQSLIEARARQQSLQLQLLRLLNPTGPDLWGREVRLIHQPTLPEIRMEAVEQHVAVAVRMRPLLNQARLHLLRGDLELVKTRNGLLPLLDLFATLGKSGYANAFGDAVDSIDGANYDASAGIRLAYPLFNRDARARHRQARLDRQQAEKALDNLLQLVEMDVHNAYIEVNRTKQQIAASSVTRAFDEQKFANETEKLRVGKSTSFLVAQAQRDLLSSRIAEVRSIVNYLKALIDLYRLDGSLLERRRIAAPGREPVPLSGK